MVKIENLSLKYQGNNGSDNTALKSVSLDLNAGRITILIGPSGAGKTSLLQCIAGLQKSYQGSISVNGVDLRNLSMQERAKKIGFVFQNFNLFPHLTALQNCVQPLIVVQMLPKKVAVQKARDVLELLGMLDFAQSYPRRLSGGQQQRVAIARALCLQPELLLLDEPTSAIDPGNTRTLVDLLLNLSKGGLAICVSSHDINFVKQIIDCVYLLQDGQVIEKFDKQVKSLDLFEQIQKFVGEEIS